MPQKLIHDYHSYEALMRYARIMGFGSLHTSIDPSTGIGFIIAIHSTALGPAIGGCRLYPYSSSCLALKDVLRLAYMMTLKAAACDLPHGGAKSVIIKPPVINDRERLFSVFGDFVHEMNGRYITALDVGTSTQDMDFIAKRTPYVIGAAGTDKTQEDPSPYTAKGVMRGIQAAIKFRLGRNDLENIHVAIQGGGKVAYYLSRLLHQQGVHITMCDPKPEATRRFVEEFNADVVGLDKIYDVECDVFSPCAIGGTINLQSLRQIKAKIIAGSANNQLAHKKCGFLAHKQGILYVPDFIINAGGLIQASALYDYHDITIAHHLIEKLYDKILNLFELAARDNQIPAEVAEKMAHEKLLTKSFNAMENS